MDAKHEEETILWRRLDRPGFEAARVERVVDLLRIGHW